MTYVPAKPDLATGAFLEVKGVPLPGAEVFDSYLKLYRNGSDNHTLTIALRIFLNQISDPHIPLMPFLDANNDAFLIKPWPAGAWAGYQRTFRRQCARWSNRFWLKPPNHFSGLDVTVGGRTVRPNIYCHLHVALVGSAAGAHRAIDVVNLDTASIPGLRGIPAAQVTSGTFQSHEELFDSLDVRPRKVRSTDITGRVRKHRFYPIVHEIGHALGLPHIGVTRQDPLCRVAVDIEAIQDSLGPGIALGVPALFAGGGNSDVCYGDFAPASRGANVMGGGTRFEESNATPWRGRIAAHTGTRAEEWTVSMDRVRPRIM